MWDQIKLSDNTKIMLNDLIERKQKWDRLKWRSLMCGWASTLSFTFMTLFFFRGTTSPTISFFYNRMSDQKFLFWIVVTGAGLVMMMEFARQSLKAKEKYEKLRSETIQHLDTRWWRRSELADRRDQISKIMKEMYDINLTYMG